MIERIILITDDMHDDHVRALTNIGKTYCMPTEQWYYHNIDYESPLEQANRLLTETTEWSEYEEEDN
jgi:hypothetical protein